MTPNIVTKTSRKKNKKNKTIKPSRIMILKNKPKKRNPNKNK